MGVAPPPWAIPQVAVVLGNLGFLNTVISHVNIYNHTMSVNFQNSQAKHSDNPKDDTGNIPSIG